MDVGAQVLQLIPSDPALAAQVADYYTRNREFLRPFEPERTDSFFTEQYQRTVLEWEAQARKLQRSYRFYIRLAHEADRIIGVIGLNEVVWGAFRSAFLGYKLDGQCLNRGYMTKAVEMMVGYAFNTLNLHRLEANVMPRNAASIRVLEKNGFVNEGYSPKYIKINGVWEDHVHMVKLNERQEAGR